MAHEDDNRRNDLREQLDEALRKLDAFQDLPVIRRAMDEMITLRGALADDTEVDDALIVRVRARTMEATWLVTLETRKTSVVDLGAALGQPRPHAR